MRRTTKNIFPRLPISHQCIIEYDTMFLDKIFFALWFFLPVGIANCTPIIAAKIPLLEQWSYPIDFYKTFRGKRILGDHKTIRGLVIGILAAIATVVIQQFIY